MSMRGAEDAACRCRGSQRERVGGRVCRHRRAIGLRQVDSDEARDRAAVSDARAPSSSTASEVTAPLKIAGMAFQNPTMLPWRTTLAQPAAAARDRPAAPLPHPPRDRGEYVDKAETLLARSASRARAASSLAALRRHAAARLALPRADPRAEAPDARRALRGARRLHARGVVVRHARPACRERGSRLSW